MRRAARSGATPRVRGGVARGVAVVEAFMTARQALQAAGIGQPDFYVTERMTYHYTENGSVFIVERPGPLDFFSSPRRRFVAGPRAGESETITQRQADAYRKQAERVYGRHIKGFWPFREERFIPGTKRDRLPIVDPCTGSEIGYLDENGHHYYKVPRPGVI